MNKDNRLNVGELWGWKQWMRFGRVLKIFFLLSSELLHCTRTISKYRKCVKPINVIAPKILLANLQFERKKRSNRMSRITKCRYCSYFRVLCKVVHHVKKGGKRQENSKSTRSTFSQLYYNIVFSFIYSYSFYLISALSHFSQSKSILFCCC